MTNDSDKADDDNPLVSTELQQFAAELARLQPRSDRLDRERLAFLAGQASVVAAASQPATILGVRLESRAWPAACAAMTAIAATLLCMLLTRPEVPGAAFFATDVRGRVGPQFSTERMGSGAVLTTRDIHAIDIERRLARLDANPASNRVSVSPKDDLSRPVFTPSAWQQVIHDTESKPVPHKSSSLPHNEGVTT